MTPPLGITPVASLGLPRPLPGPPPRFAQEREFLSLRRKREKSVAGWLDATAASRRQALLRLTRLWWFDRHAFVDIAHADGKLYRAKFNGFVAGVFNLFPANVAAPPVNLNAGLILTDERIFDERRKCAVAHQFFPAVGGFGALRENFDNQNRVLNFSRRHIHHFAIARTTHQQVRIVIRFPLRDANPDIVHERSARRVAQMCVQSSDQIYGNRIVPQRSASHRKDFAAHVLVPHRAARFQAQVFFLRDGAVFLNEHSRAPNFNSDYYATCFGLLVGKRVTADEP